MDTEKKERMPEKSAFWVGVSLLVLAALFQGRALLMRAAGPLPPWSLRLLALPLCLLCFGLPYLLSKQFFAATAGAPPAKGGAAVPQPRAGRSRVPVWVLLPLFLGAVVLANSIMSLLRMLAEALFAAKPAEATPLPEDGWELLLYFLFVCVLSPLMEELFFRGAVQRMLRIWGRRFAIWAAAVAFALVHAGWWQLPTVLVLGLALGYVYEVSRSVRACVALHFANNAAAFVMQVARERMQTDAGFALILWLMILLVALFIGAVWAVRHFKLGRKLWLKHDAAELGSLRARLWRAAKVLPFPLGMAALVVQFVLTTQGGAAA